MLSRVLLHVVTATSGVDLAADVRAWGEVFHGFHIVNDATVFCLGYFGDAMSGTVRRDPSGVVDLASAGGIEGGPVESDCWTRGLRDFADFRVEVVEEGVVVVEAVGHRIFI